MEITLTREQYKDLLLMIYIINHKGNKKGSDLRQDSIL